MPKDGEKPAREAHQHKSDNQHAQQKQAGGESKRSGGSNKSNGNGDENQNEIAELIQSQHQSLSAALAKWGEDADVGSIVTEFAIAWIPHDDVEIEMLYPARVSAGDDIDALTQTVIRHDIINWLLRDLMAQPGQNSRRAKLEILAAEYRALQSMEDGLGDVSERLESASKSSPDLLDAMKERVEDMKRRLERQRLSDDLGGALGALAPRSLSTRSSQQFRRETEMQRNQNYRDRDEQGRFLSEDERGRGYERESRGRHEDDDRDERRSRSRYDEDERYRGREEPGRGRSHGGWFGDSEGHSEAARRAWQGGRHGESGWFGDPEGHSEASRRGWRSGHHGESGWFGDPEGHSQASRRAWEDREGDYRQGNGGESRSRGRYDDERRGDERRAMDERRGGDERRSMDERRLGDERRHGGWFGDPEGHSQASRRGWDEREGGEYRSRERDDDDRDRRRRYDH